MNQKQIGFFLILIGCLILFSTFIAKNKEDKLIDSIIEDKGGSCYLEDGTCLHADRDLTFYIISWILSGSLIVFGSYLSFVDKTQEKLVQHQVKVSKALVEAKKKDKFDAYLASFESEEKKVLKVIKNQEGILQSTLRYKTGMSKTSLSLMLKSLEKRKVITRKPKGKTKKVFLIKKWI